MVGLGGSQSPSGNFPNHLDLDTTDTQGGAEEMQLDENHKGGSSVEEFSKVGNQVDEINALHEEYEQEKLLQLAPINQEVTELSEEVKQTAPGFKDRSGEFDGVLDDIGSVLDSENPLAKGTKLEQSIEGTVKEVDDNIDSDSINSLLNRIKNAKTLGEKISVLFSSIADLIGGFLGALGTGKGQESAEKLIQYESLDFTEYTPEQMVGKDKVDQIDPESLPSLQEIAGGENPYSKGSIMHFLTTKIQNSGSITQKLAWTSAYTSARIFTKEKLAGNKEFDFDAYKQMRGYEKIKDTVQPGDMIVVGSGSGGMENNVLRSAALGSEHIMMVGKNRELYHSTMKKKNGKSGFEKRNMESYLNERSPSRLGIVRPPSSVYVDSMISKADELIEAHEENPELYGYSRFDAALSLMFGTTLGDKKANCAKFVGLCLEDGGYGMPEDAGNPATYFDEKGFSIEHFGTYVG